METQKLPLCRTAGTRTGSVLGWVRHVPDFSTPTSAVIMSHTHTLSLTHTHTHTHTLIFTTHICVHAHTHTHMVQYCPVLTQG